MDTLIHESETLRLTRALIAQNTIDPPGNEHLTAIIISRLLTVEGIEHELIDLAPGRSNLVARIKGNGSRKALAFSAHFDTIGVEAEKWTHDPFAAEIEDGRLYGRGATDMKGAMAAMVMAAVEIKRSALTLEGDLLLTFSASENTGCLGARQLVDHGVFDGVGALLVSEPSSMRLFVSEKGKLTLRATAAGEYGHNAFSDGRSGDRGNAIVRLAQYLDKANDLQLRAPPHRHLTSPTINIGLIRGGLSTVLIPSEAVAEIDIRMVPGLQPEAVLRAFRDIAGDHIFIEQLEYIPPVDTADDDPFVELCVAACSAETGQVCLPQGIGYMSDGAVIVPALNIPMVIIGPGEAGMSGAVDEYVELDKLEAATRLFRDIAERYLS